MTTVTDILMLSTANISCEEYLEFFNQSCNSSIGVNGTLVLSAPTTKATPTGSGNNSWDDATWILTSAFVIFTMQSGKYKATSQHKWWGDEWRLRGTAP